MKKTFLSSKHWSTPSQRALRSTHLALSQRKWPASARQLVSRVAHADGISSEPSAQSCEGHKYNYLINGISNISRVQKFIFNLQFLVP